MNHTKHAHYLAADKGIYTFYAEFSAHPSNRLLKFKKTSLSFCLFTLYKQFLWDKNFLFCVSRQLFISAMTDY